MQNVQWMTEDREFAFDFNPETKEVKVFFKLEEIDAFYQFDVTIDDYPSFVEVCQRWVQVHASSVFTLRVKKAFRKEQDQPLSAYASTLLEYMLSTYLKEGYHSSGSIGGNLIQHALQTSDWKIIGSTLQELVEKGFIQKRACKAFAYELAPKVRKFLILEHDLATKWEKDKTGSAFYPNSSHGEITKVLNSSGGDFDGTHSNMCAMPVTGGVW